MGLFTNPVVLNDGVDATRNFSFRSQRNDPKSIVGDYIEDASQPIAANSLLVVKHDTRAVPRHLLQRIIDRIPAANTLGQRKRITVNLTITADPEFTDAEVQTEVNILIDAAQESGFVAGMLQSKL